MQKYLKLKLNSTDYTFSEVKAKTNDFLESQGFSNETIQSQVVILKELIRNGLEYGNCLPSKDTMTVYVHFDDNSITIELKKSIAENASIKLEELDKTIQLMRGYQDPFVAYMEKIKEVAENSLGGEPNGLGLAKIAYEKNAIIDYFVSEDKILNMSATRNYESDLSA
jgi:hypothetical protein